MTARTAFRWLLPAVAVGVAGCSKPTATTEPATAAPAIVAPLTDDLRPTEPAQATKPAQPAKSADAPVVLPSDGGGKMVAKALVVQPPLPADGSAVVKPRAYSSALDRGELPLPTVSLRPFSPTEPKGSTAKPTPPAERNMPDAAVATLPEGKATDRPKVKAAAPPNSGAADVPMNAWRQNDRASLDDPTADLSAVRVIETPLPATMVYLPFLRGFIPNPFEYADQLKGKVGREGEVGTGPVK